MNRQQMRRYLQKKDAAPVEAYGVRGAQSKPWRQTFPSQDAYERWLSRHEGDVEVHGTREAEA